MCISVFIFVLIDFLAGGTSWTWLLSCCLLSELCWKRLNPDLFQLIPQLSASWESWE